LGSTLSIGSRTRFSAGAARSNMQKPAFVDPANRSATSANRPNRYAWDACWNAEGDLKFGGVLLAALQHQANVTAGATHVESKDGVMPRVPRIVSSPDDATGETREQQLCRSLERLLGEKIATI